MSTHAELLSDIKRELGEPASGSTHWGSDDTVFTRKINTIIDEIIQKTHCVTDYTTMSAVAYQYEYDLPTNYLDVVAVFYNGEKLTQVTEQWLDYYDYDWRFNSGTPERYYIDRGRRKLCLHSVPDELAGTTTVTTALSSGNITVASTSDFEDRGSIIIGTEVISYTNKSCTQFKGCTRGDEGTTAATHSSGDTVTERDIKIVYADKQTDLSENDDVPFNSLRHLYVYHPLITKGVIASCKPEDEDQENVIARCKIDYRISLKEMKAELRHSEDADNTLMGGRSY